MTIGGSTLTSGRDVLAEAAGGVMFHHFHGGVHPAGQGSISADELDAMVDHLGPERILPAAEWLRRAASGSLAPGEICLTFDDNLRCQFDVARPVLQRRGITAFWFVYSSVLEGKLERLEIYRRFRMQCFESVDEFYDEFLDHVSSGPRGAAIRARLAGFRPESYLPHSPFYSNGDRRFRFVRDELLGAAEYHAAMDRMLERHGTSPSELAAGLWMDASCLAALHAEGHVVGLHSHTHPTRMTLLDETGQRAEYAQNAAVLEGLLGVSPRTVSHPCNSYDARTLRILAELGIVAGFRADTARPAISPLEFPRIDHAVVLNGMRS